MLYNILVQPFIAAKLIDLNHQFYQTFSRQFSATRQRLQPGVYRILETLSASDAILDLGCGNGELARQLAHRQHQGNYAGLDFSAGLLDEARQSVPANLKAIFLQNDLTQEGWEADLPIHSFETILAFAALHHLPGDELRLQVLKTVRSCLAPSGRFIHSEWQFLNSARLRTRLQPWETLGLTESLVDPGDYLLDWRHGGYGLRYVHHFSQQELESLAWRAGFQVAETFFSDGKGGNWGIYQVWQQARHEPGETIHPPPGTTG